MSSPYSKPPQDRDPGPQQYGQYPPPYGAPYGQQQYPPRPPYGAPGYGLPVVDKHTGWFVVNWLFFWPLALYSLLSAYLNIDRALYAGDLAGAHYQAGRVRKFGIIALCIGLAWIVLVIGLMTVAVSTTSHCYSTYGSC